MSTKQMYKIEKNNEGKMVNVLNIKQVGRKDEIDPPNVLKDGEL